MVVRVSVLKENSLFGGGLLLAGLESKSPPRREKKYSVLGGVCCAEGDDWEEGVNSEVDAESTS